MNPLKYAQMMKYLTRAKKANPELPDVFPASKAPIPPVKQEVKEIEAVNQFMLRNPRVEKAGGGMLVQPGFGGVRQGYSGDGMEKDRLKVANKYAQLENKKNYYDLGKKERASIRYIMEKNDNKFFKDYKIREKNVKRFETKKENLLKKTFNLTDADFLEHGKFGVSQKIDGKVNPKFTKIINFIKRDFSLPKVTKEDVLTSKQIKSIKDNFDLPDGVKEWNFKSIKNPEGFKYGVAGSRPGPFKTGYPQLFKQIKRYIENPEKRTIQANTATTKGWMMSAMERVYKNETKNNVKFKNLTYQPIKKNNIIVGFKDTTPSGNNKIYYGLNKNAEEFGDGADWTTHGDYKRIDKFIDIANRVKANPDNVLKKILNKKGINTALRLNDILSHQRYYETLSETTPQTLLKRQIVLHHTGGVGAADNVARAAATKDIQLLTGAINAKVSRIENILAKTGIVSAEDNKFLKNSGARIKGADGKIYGGGFINPERQYKSIEKAAIDYAKSDQFNIKTVNSYLERIGCGKSGGGRVLYNKGAFGLTKCAEKGVNVIKEGNYKTAEQAQDAAKLLSGGKNVLRAITKYGVVPELAFVAGESLFRTTLGEEPLNALKKSIDSFTLGATDFTSGIEAEKFGKYADDKLNVDKFRNSQALVDSLQNKLTNLKAITDQGGEGYVGDLTSDIQMTQAQLKAAEQELQKNTVSSDLVQFIDRRGQEIADTQMAKSNFAKQSLKDEMDGIPGIRDYTDTESTRIFPAQREINLNLDMFPNFSDAGYFMNLKTSDAINLAQAYRAQGDNVSAKDILAYRDQLKNAPLSELAKTYGDEQIYGTQGADVLQPLAGGGIAKLAGVSSGPPPESGPNSQGLLSLKNRVRNY